MNDKDAKALEAYKHTINRIDDWFEYMNESEKDREFIHLQLDKLMERLTKIYNSGNTGEIGEDIFINGKIVKRVRNTKIEIAEDDDPIYSTGFIVDIDKN